MAAPPVTFAPRNGPAPTTCILWTAAAEAPAALTDLLAQRGFALEAASDRFGAMAAACCASSTGRRPVVILDQPERLKGAAELIATLQGRLPQAVIWTFDPARKPQLSSVEAPSAADGSNRPANGTVQPQIPLRLVGEPQPARAVGIESRDASEAWGESEPADRRSMLSAEELEMLLADEPDERGKR
jgi:hypothetical protein